MLRFWLVVSLVFAASTLALNPVVLFPGYALETIDVSISGANIDGCPSSGSFQIYWQFTSDDLNGIPLDCVPKYLELIYDEDKNQLRNQQGVRLNIAGRDIGDANDLHPLYDDMIQYFVDRGYKVGTSDATFRAVGYDWRTVPYLDVTAGGLDDPGFMDITEKTIKDAYNAAGQQKVYLVGHSNGPIMQLYFLTNIGQSFRDKYIAGSITLSGNIAGQGLGSVSPVIGFTPQDFSFQTTWTNACKSFPSSYMSAAQPDYFSGDNEITIVQTSTKEYTTQDYDKLYTDAGATFAKNHWRDWIGVVTPYSQPYGGGVPVFSFYGAGVNAAVGVKLDSFPVTEFDGSNTDNYFFLVGDGNQEAIDNESVLLWEQLMPDGCFDHMEVPGVDHFAQNQNPGVIQKLYSIVSGPVSALDCSAGGSSTSNSSKRSSTSNSSKNSSSDASVVYVSAFLFIFAVILV